MSALSNDKVENETILEILEDLIEITRDGQEGFAQSAEHAESSELKQIFSNYSRQRGAIITDLQQLERQYGKPDVDTAGSVTGSLHRAWINIRTAVAARNDQAILEEAERGEDAAVEAFQDALSPQEGVLPENVNLTISRHLAQIKQAHDDVRDRRDSGRYARKDA